MSKLVQAGGTAKTTSTAALGVLLSRQGIPTYLLDMDPQASLTRAFGISDQNDRLYHCLTDRAGLPKEQIAENLSISPSTIELSRVETELLGEPGREFFLRTCLRSLRLAENIVVLIDCPPSLGVLAVYCLSAAGGVITVVQPGGFELHALVHLHMTLDAIRDRVNPDLHVLGAIITNAHRRRSVTNHVIEEVDRIYPVLGTISSDARLLYATSSGTLQRLTRSKALDDYAEVITKLQTVL